MIIENDRTETPKIGKELLRQLQNKEITMADFDRECCYWSLKHIDELKRQYPPEMPTDLQEYNESVKMDSRIRATEGFWQQDHIKRYSAESSRVRSDNAGNWRWLKFMQKCIPAEDAVAQAKINKVLEGYEAHP